MNNPLNITLILVLGISIFVNVFLCAVVASMKQAAKNNKNTIERMRVHLRQAAQIIKPIVEHRKKTLENEANKTFKRDNQPERPPLP